MTQLSEEAVSELITINEPRKTLDDLINEIRKATGPGSRHFQFLLLVSDSAVDGRESNVGWYASWFDTSIGDHRHAGGLTAMDLIADIKRQIS